MKKETISVAGEEILRSPTLAKLGEIAARFVGINLVAVFPQKDRWEQLRLGGTASHQTFCRLVQSTREGEKKCRMCHAVMSVAASRDGLAVRHCHAGLSTIVAPVSPLSKTGQAVLSTCMFTEGGRSSSWKTASKSGRKSGLELKPLREAFETIPEIDKEKLELAQALIVAASAAVEEVKKRREVEEKLATMEAAQKPAGQRQSALIQELKKWGGVEAGQQPQLPRHPCKKAKCPALVEVVANLVVQKPNLPYTVSSLAATARITPNHFSSLFHHWMGQSFLDFLHAARINAAKEMLHDLSLSISEVAYRVGYEDANYFSRRFRQATGMIPRQWRNTRGGGHPDVPGRTAHRSGSPPLTVTRAEVHGRNIRREIGDGG